MELRPNVQIKTVIKALQEVILPAVDPQNKVAIEQAHLAVSQLTLVLHCLPLMYRYDKDELSRFLALGETLKRTAAELPEHGEILQALEAAMTAGAQVLSHAGAEPAELEAANFSLRETIGAIISAVYAENDFPALQETTSAIMDHAREQLLRERALIVSQGWEPDAKSIPAIVDLISAPAVTRANR